MSETAGIALLPDCQSLLPLDEQALQHCQFFSIITQNVERKVRLCLFFSKSFAAVSTK